MADEPNLSLLSSQLSLQELCEKKSLSQILSSSFAASDFAALEPRLQELLFNKLRTENIRLREIEKKWCQLTESLPLIDTRIYLSRTRIKYPDVEDVENSEDEGSRENEGNGKDEGNAKDEGNGEHEENGYIQRERVLEQWSYHGTTANDNDSESGGNPALYTGRAEGNEDHLSSSTRITNPIKWSVQNLVSESSDSDLRICVRHPSGRCFCSSDWSSSFSCRISSQLLLYRLTVTFGMPPPKDTDEYKTCWELELKHRDGASVMTFQDYKGAADGYFYGTTGASDDALMLLKFLTGMNCPHTYDGIVAGTIA